MDELLEPLKAYNEKFSDEFLKNTEEMFDALLSESNVDIAANRATVEKFNYETGLTNLAEGNIRGLKFKRSLLVALTVFGAVMAIVGIFLLIGGEFITVGAITLPLGAVLVLIGVIVQVKVINPRIKTESEKKNKHARAAQKYNDEAWKQTAPLNALFDDNMTKRLIEKTVPLLVIDDNFSMRRLDCLVGKYGFDLGDSPDRSTIGIMTGEILGNPFVINRELVHSMGTQTYTGSLLITWTETVRDSDGNTHTEHHSQTLIATVTRPKPYYHSRTNLIYCNDAAPDLHFTHEPSHAEKMDEKELERTIKAGVKKIRDIQEKSSLTEMGNEKFDVLFGALDRDNEVQFRLLFTPLAQKNMLSLMLDKDGYGDDFFMRKAGCINYMSSEHSINWDPGCYPEQYYSYSVDIARKKFVSGNTQYFRSLFFDFAPLLSIPLYQQHKPREYIYKDAYERNFTRYESEFAANNLGYRAFTPHDAATASILKTRFAGADGKTDRVLVTAYAYRTEKRVDFVPTLGGDGEMHAVPVEWDEYIPVSNTETVLMKEFGMSRREFGASDLPEQLKSRIFGYGHGILCCMSSKDPEFESNFDSALNTKTKTEVKN